MKLNIVPMTAGQQWIFQSFAAFKRSPMHFIGLAVLSFFMTFALSSTLPYIGPLLAFMVSVYFSLAFMIATDNILHNNPSSFTLLLNGILNAPAGKRPLFTLSVMYMAATVLVWLVCRQITASLFPELTAQFVELTMRLSDPNSSSIVLSENDQMLLVQYVSVMSIQSLFIYVIVLFFFLFTPALVYWGQIPAAKAIFFNLIAGYKNIAAFALYAVMWLALLTISLFIVSLFCSLLAMLLGLNTFTTMLLFFIVVTCFMALFALFQISVYFAFKACFKMDAPAPASVPPQ
ncbi:hypothetical protein CUZ56_00418 [Saezia sanguinis]|uniref:Transmembrane protein n=1 Tax=Saezia sanguinis TaxID=1965230 RepID=A0A433SGW4_9BURK|nr:BPSS1780 family membrane protein [Saezia sanguinis]RUS67936.1 hypothetical protein CUZ56_00418 [Saezia sanguinis]